MADPAVAIAVPAKDEADALPRCLAALDAAAARYGGPVAVVVLANNCADATADVLAATRLRHAVLHPRAATLLPGHRHAGWARRLALDEAAALLHAPGDLLLCTDADTDVDPHWIERTAALIADGYDAVAGRALTPRAERQALGEEARRRLALILRYFLALDYLRTAALRDADDPWPRHFYEGGASLALTLETYRRIGGAPTPPVGEDRALFAAVRAVGGRVRHATDVRVFTSCRLTGRAQGGMADALAGWIAQGEDVPLHELYAVDAALAGAADAGDRLTLRRLPAALAEAQRRIRALRAGAPAPVVPLRRNRARSRTHLLARPRSPAEQDAA